MNKEYIWVGAKTGKIAKDNHEGLYMFDLAEGSYDLYRKCDGHEEPQEYVWVINWMTSGFNNFMYEIFMDFEKAQQRYCELKTLLNDQEVNTLRMDHACISDYGEEKK